MENKRQQPGSMESTEGRAERHAGEQTEHKRIRSLHDELPGMEPMLSDPGEPHKSVEPRSGRLEELSGREQEFLEPQRGSRQRALLGEDDESQKEPLLGEDEDSQKHPLLGEESVSMENESEEQKRRRIEAERSSRKKPAA